MSKPEPKRVASIIPVNKAVKIEPTTPPVMGEFTEKEPYSQGVPEPIHTHDEQRVLNFWYDRGVFAREHGKQRNHCPIPEVGTTYFGSICRKYWLDGIAEGQHRAH